MTLNNLCDLFDASYIADHKSELNNGYIASSELIYSDGKFTSHINAEGYIEITSVSTESNYLIFIDNNGDIFLSVYKYLAETKFKEIIDDLNILRSQTGMHKHTTTSTYEPTIMRNNNNNNPIDDDHKLAEFSGTIVTAKDEIEEAPKYEDPILTVEGDAKLININNMECEECGSTEFVEPFWLYKDGRLKCKCSKCGTIYDLIPSKYYVISSKRIFTNTELNRNRRQIILREEVKNAKN